MLLELYGGFPILGVPFWGPPNKDYSRGLPIFGIYQMYKAAFLDFRWTPQPRTRDHKG